jgi:hypothetical protein
MAVSDRIHIIGTGISVQKATEEFFLVGYNAV